jgi:O-succinylhomoserine sulfhydrylase
MAAILTIAMAHLQAGDHVVCSRSVFGATIQLFSNILGRFGITTTYVDLSNTQAWQDAVQVNTKLFYLETPSNPLTEIADIKAISKIAKKAKALFTVDNCFCTPALQKPLELGADVIIHSATKYLDGQGRVLGGAIVGTHAGDMIGELALAIEMGADATDIGRTIHPHPTLSEATMEAMALALGRPVNF